VHAGKPQRLVRNSHTIACEAFFHADAHRHVFSMRGVRPGMACYRRPKRTLPWMGTSQALDVQEVRSVGT